jgi:hypothetical protein
MQAWPMQHRFGCRPPWRKWLRAVLRLEPDSLLMRLPSPPSDDRSGIAARVRLLRRVGDWFARAGVGVGAPDCRTCRLNAAGVGTGNRNAVSSDFCTGDISVRACRVWPSAVGAIC